MRIYPLFIALLLFLPILASAHEDHRGVEGNPYEEYGVPIEEKQVREFSKFVVNKLVTDKKLGEHWRAAKVSRINKQEFKGEKQWVVEVSNVQEPKPEWKTMYIFMNEFGEFRGVNFTGK